jgi:hypothetical protein
VQISGSIRRGSRSGLVGPWLTVLRQQSNYEDDCGEARDPENGVAVAADHAQDPAGEDAGAKIPKVIDEPVDAWFAPGNSAGGPAAHFQDRASNRGGAINKAERIAHERTLWREYGEHDADHGGEKGHFDSLWRSEEFTGEFSCYLSLKPLGWARGLTCSCEGRGRVGQG